MPNHPSRDLPAWIDPVVVAVWTALFGGWALSMGYADWPLGDGWNRYLGNAIAIAEADWGGYLPWRGPAHAWLCLAVMPVSGSLVRASQWVALGSTAALFPLTWALGRALFGRWAGLVALGLLAAWPDLRLFAWFSSPYALEGALVAAGTLAGVTAVDAIGGRRALHLLLAAALLGVAIAVDVRGVTLTAAIALALALNGSKRGQTPDRIHSGRMNADSSGASGSNTPRARALRALALVAGAATVGAGLYALLPVSFYSLASQVNLQRDHVAPLVAACSARGDTAPTLADVTGPCGRALIQLNLTRAAAAIPLWLGIFPLVAVIGAWPRRWPDLGRRALLVLPLLTLAPALPVVAIQHRYLVPLAPFAAVLLAAGLGRVAIAVRARAPGLRPHAVLAGAVLVYALVWNLAGPSLRTRVSGTARGGTATASLTHRGAVVVAADVIRAGYRPGERVTDCASANLRERLYPIPVGATDSGSALRACRGLGTRPPTAAGWLLTRAEGTPDPGWEVVFGGATPGAVVLLRAGAE